MFLEELQTHRAGVVLLVGPHQYAYSFDCFMKHFSIYVRENIKNLAKISHLIDTDIPLKNAQDFFSASQSTIMGDTPLEAIDWKDRRNYFTFIINNRKILAPHDTNCHMLDDGLAHLYPHLFKPKEEIQYAHLIHFLQAKQSNPFALSPYPDGTISFESDIAEKIIKIVTTGRAVDDRNIEILSILAARLFISEPRRNPGCFITSLMLLDLIKNKFVPPLGNPLLYTLYNSLPQDQGKAITVPLDPHLNTPSFFYPPVGNSDSNDEMTLADIQSFIIITDWLSFKGTAQPISHALLWNKSSVDSQPEVLTNLIFPKIWNEISDLINGRPLKFEWPALSTACLLPSTAPLNWVAQEKAEAIPTVQEHLFQPDANNRHPPAPLSAASNPRHAAWDAEIDWTRETGLPPSLQPPHSFPFNSSGDRRLIEMIHNNLIMLGSSSSSSPSLSFSPYSPPHTLSVPQSKAEAISYSSSNSTLSSNNSTDTSHNSFLSPSPSSALLDFLSKDISRETMSDWTPAWSIPDDELEQELLLIAYSESLSHAGPAVPRGPDQDLSSQLLASPSPYTETILSSPLLAPKRPPSVLSSNSQTFFTLETGSSPSTPPPLLIFKEPKEPSNKK